ncbi:MAG: hypothetical protein R6V55_00285 [Desulfovermiculus sp.]
MKNEKKDKKDLISLNSKVLESTSIEELEERLEFSSWTCGSFDSPCGCDGAWNDGFGCTPEQE